MGVGGVLGSPRSGDRARTGRAVRSPGELCVESSRSATRESAMWQGSWTASDAGSIRWSPRPSSKRPPASAWSEPRRSAVCRGCWESIERSGAPRPRCNVNHEDTRRSSWRRVLPKDAWVGSCAVAAREPRAVRLPVRGVPADRAGCEKPLWSPRWPRGSTRSRCARRFQPSPTSRLSAAARR